MKKYLLKTFGLFVAVFTVSQVSQAENVNTKAPELNDGKNTPHTTSSHGGGCCCVSCSSKDENS